MKELISLTSALLISQSENVTVRVILTRLGVVHFRIPGPQLKDWHTVGFDEKRDPRFSFPPNFCLGELLNDTCHTPAGVAAIAYDDNPLVG